MTCPDMDMDSQFDREWEKWQEADTERAHELRNLEAFTEEMESAHNAVHDIRKSAARAAGCEDALYGLVQAMDELCATVSDRFAELGQPHMSPYITRAQIEQERIRQAREEP